MDTGGGSRGNTAGRSQGRAYERVGRPEDLPVALQRLGLAGSRPVLVSVGGAGGMAPEHLAAMQSLLRGHVLPLLERWGAAVVDGGTDAGVMKVMGRVFHSAGTRLPLVGVAAEGTVHVPGLQTSAPHGAALEPGHTHFLLVPGATWGDESQWLCRVATVLAGDGPSATLVFNGGEITYKDVAHSLQASRPVVVVAGAGRTADAIAAAAEGQIDDERASRLARSPLLHVVRLEDPEAVAAALENCFRPTAPAAETSAD